MPLSPATSSLGPEALRSLGTLSPFDWVLLVFALWSVVRGFLHGAIRELFGLLATIVALLVADWYYRPGAVWLVSHGIAEGKLADPVAFLLLGAAVFLGLLLLGRLLRALVHLVGLGFFDRLAGALFGLARAALLSVLLLTALTAFLPPQPWLLHSRLAPPIARLARELAPLAPVELEQRVRSGVHALLDPWRSWH